MKYALVETNQFLVDFENIAVWILVSNSEQSDVFAEKKLNEFAEEMATLKSRLGSFPESGEMDIIQGVRRFPIYSGRYSVKWIVNNTSKTVVLISIADSKYPKSLRHFQFNE